MTQLFLIAAPMLLIASLAGYGALFAGRLDFFESAFAGLFLICGAALVLNFFTGFGTAPGPWVLAAGLGLFAIFQWRRGFALNAALLFLTFAVSVAFWLRAGTQLPVDAGLYYLSAMNWAAHQPVPLGLANLQAQFGFDSVWLLFESALRSGPLLGWSHLAIAEIALRSIALGWIAQNALAEKNRGEPEKSVFYLTSFAVLFVYMLVRAPSPATTDLPANILAFCAWMAFCRMLLEERRGGAGADSLPLLCLLVVLSVSFKLSMLPLALLPMLLAMRGGLDFFSVHRRLLLIVSLYAVLWLARNFLLSGCLVFPVAASCLKPAWSAGRDAAPVVLVIRGWARAPGTLYMSYAGLFDLRWVPAWLAGFFRSAEFWLVAAAAGFGLVLSFFRRGRRLPVPPVLLWTSAVCAGAGLLLWFFSAPNPRFSWVFFAMAAVLLLLPAMPQAGAWLCRIRVRPLTARRALCFSAVLALLATALQIHRGAGRIDAPVPPARIIAVFANARIYAPADGDQCWELFPCTPYGFGGKTVEAWHGRPVFRGVRAD